MHVPTKKEDRNKNTEHLMKKTMKRYIVFLKQVPLSTKVGIDPVTKTLKRSSAMSQTNPDDLYALQVAVNLSRQTGAEVVAVSMGPASAQTVLREALQRGAHRAILLSSAAFAGSDTWCTSLILAEAVRKIGDYDMLFFGKMAIDGDTAQVGPEVAGHLDIPQVTSFSHFESVMPQGVCVCKRWSSSSKCFRWLCLAPLWWDAMPPNCKVLLWRDGAEPCNRRLSFGMKRIWDWIPLMWA